MKRILLSQGRYALVDDEDYAWLSRWKWSVAGDYAGRTEYISGYKKTQKLRHILMHSLIMNTPKGLMTDHRDGNGLNNQRSNLRVCTHTENMRNRKMARNNTSGYKGVTWDKYKGKWKAGINLQGGFKHLGNFSDVQDAAAARRAAELAIFGEFAR